MPDGMVIGQPFPDVKQDASGVTDPTGQHPGKHSRAPLHKRSLSSRRGAFLQRPIISGLLHKRNLSDHSSEYRRMMSGSISSGTVHKRNLSSRRGAFLQRPIISGLLHKRRLSDHSSEYRRMMSGSSSSGTKPLMLFPVRILARISLEETGTMGISTQENLRESPGRGDTILGRVCSEAEPLHTGSRHPKPKPRRGDTSLCPKRGTMMKWTFSASQAKLCQRSSEGRLSAPMTKQK